ncbi:MAG: hypothetical protein ACI4HI_16650 [Lachnospiraceae bacterium]
MKSCFEKETAVFIKSPCLLIDPRPGLAPIETILIVLHKRDRKPYRQLAESLHFGKRLLIVTAKEISLLQFWIADCWKRGIAVNAYIRKPLAEDLLYFDIYYVLYSCQKRNWVYHRLRRFVFDHTGMKNEEELSCLMTQYWKYHGYAPNFLRTIHGKRTVILDKLLERMLRFQVILYNRISRRYYLRRIQSMPEFSQAHFRLLNKKGESSSGCVFLRVQKESKDWFIKGNESPVFHSIRNEIAVQKRLLSYHFENHYLYMSLCDRNGAWIGYPFENKRTLRHILKERQLTNDELKRLGLFLLSTLDELYEMNIIHRDYRAENIMAEEDTDKTIKAFLLFDFGCSVMDGKDVWGEKTFWNQYLAHQVCGEGRYNERIVDDAAAAYAVYLKCGGNPDDPEAKEIEKRIGRLII